MVNAIPKSVCWWSLALTTGEVFAQTNKARVQLRAELNHQFSLGNLVLAFLPRNQEVGDILDTRGAVYARSGGGGDHRIAADLTVHLKSIDKNGWIEHRNGSFFLV